MVADLHHFDEMQDPNYIKVNSRNRILIKVESRSWIRNTDPRFEIPRIPKQDADADGTVAFLPALIIFTL